MGKKRGGYYNNRMAIAKQTDADKMRHIAEFVGPNLISSFALSLYSNTDMSIDDIHYICSQVQDLWIRSTNEGWNIRENCYELTGIDVRRWSDTGIIEYDARKRRHTMAEVAEYRRSHRWGSEDGETVKRVG